MLEKYNTAWNKVSADVKKEFDSEQLLIWILRLKKDDSYYLPKFLKECIYVEKNGIRHINVNLSNFFSSDESDEV